jgi:hypothetical protein
MINTARVKKTTKDLVDLIGSLANRTFALGIMDKFLFEVAAK